MKLRHLLANSPKVKQMDKQKLMQREVGRVSRGGFFIVMIPLLHKRVLLDLFGSSLQLEMSALVLL